MAAKDTASYWKNRICRRRVSGKISRHYYARMMHEDHRAWICLDTGDAAQAANIAAIKWSELKAKGWTAIKPQKGNKDTLTVGNYIKEVRAASIFRKATMESYEKKFRQLVSEIKGLSVPSRQAPNKAADWTKTVDSVKLSEITDERVEKWRAKRLRQFPEDSEAQRRAETTVNSILRNARSLFGQKVRNHLQFDLTDPPLVNVHVGSVRVTAYAPEVDLNELMQAAEKELSGDMKVAFLLAAGCGLRRSEIDRLRREDISQVKVWKKAIDPNGKEMEIEVLEGRLRVDDTPDGRTKADSSKRTIPFKLDGPLGKALQEAPLGIYVVCPSAPLPKTRKLGTYRCGPLFQELTVWLREQGITRASQPIHYLRKSFGDRIAEIYGIHSAANTLGNSIKMAHTVYSDRTKTKGII